GTTHTADLAHLPSAVPSDRGLPSTDGGGGGGGLRLLGRGHVLRGRPGAEGGGRRHRRGDRWEDEDEDGDVKLEEPEEPRVLTPKQLADKLRLKKLQEESDLELEKETFVENRSKKSKAKKKKGVVPRGGLKATMKDDLAGYGGYDGGYVQDYEDFM
ncbi:hypothetical protein E2I00_005137, partial [Balaenoptera physalus]